MQHSSKLFLFLALSVLVESFSHAQVFSRIEAGFSIKEKNSDGTSGLTMGKVYYDKNIRQIVFNISFPRSEMMVVKDTLIYRIIDNKLLEKVKTNEIIDFSILNLCLNGMLQDFGLKNSSYHLTNMEKDSNMVISTWEPHKALVKIRGKIILSKIDKKLNGLVAYSPEGKIVAKQFFRDYQNIDGLNFPAKIIQFIYLDDKEEHKLTTYKDIIVNNFSNEKDYNYTIPVE